MAVENEVMMRLGAEEASSLASSWNAMGSQMQGMLRFGAGMAAGLWAVKTAATIVYETLVKSTAAFEENADSRAKLGRDVAMVAKQSEILRPHAAALVTIFQDQAQSISKASTASDAEIRSLQRMAMNHGILAGQIDATVTASLDFASATGTDVHTAMMRLSQASNGVYMGWQKWGIQIDRNKTALENFDSILAQIHTRFGGAAQADMGSYAGKVKELAKAWDEFYTKSSLGPIGSDMKNEWRELQLFFLRMMASKKEALKTGPELYASDQALIAAREARAAMDQEMAAEIARQIARRQAYKDAVSFAEFAKRAAADEKNRLEATISMEKELKQVEDQRWDAALANFGRMAKEYQDMSIQERSRAKKIYQTVDEQGLGGWEGLTKSQREWYGKTGMGQEQLKRQGIYEAQADRDATWLRQASGATKVQVDAEVKHEIIVRIGDTDPMTVDAIVSKATDQIKEYYARMEAEIRRSYKVHMDRANEYTAAAAATGGDK